MGLPAVFPFPEKGSSSNYAVSKDKITFSDEKKEEEELFLGEDDSKTEEGSSVILPVKQRISSIRHSSSIRSQWNTSPPSPEDLPNTAAAAAAALKSELKSLMARHDGCTKHPDVQNVIDQLTKLNPSKHIDSIINCPTFLGEFTALSAPNFPGRIKPSPQHDQQQQPQVEGEPQQQQNSAEPFDPGTSHNEYKYTLGRLSFNIFQPQKLVCTLRNVRNIVIPTSSTEEAVEIDGISIPPVVVGNPNREGGRSHRGQQQHHERESSSSSATFAYPLILDITVHTEDGEDLPATLINEAICYESTDVKNRVMVNFTGGTLMPAHEIKTDLTKLKLWVKTFEGVYTKADEERSYLGWTFQFLLKSLLGLTLPTDKCSSKSTSSFLLNDDSSSNHHVFHFEMKRSPLGYLDVLYLDDDLRITKGNRGTIVVVERTALEDNTTSSP